MKATKLPSGSWRVRVYDYTDKDGKQHYKSFTCDDKTLKGKKKCEHMATTWALEKNHAAKLGITFGEALDMYIADREATRSASTIREYKRIREKHMQALMSKSLQKLTQEDIQRCIDQEYKTHSAKTIRNWHGLIYAVLKEYRPDFRVNTNLPKKEQADIYVPSEAEIKELLAVSKGTELELPILLAAFGPMRRGEICALRYESIDGSRVHVRENMVKDSSKSWLVKAPKSFAGDRFIDYPDFVAKHWAGSKKKKGRITDLNPDNITNQFGRLLVRNGIVDDEGSPRYHFHCLRHFCISYLHAKVKLPDAYIMERGGWENDGVLKNVYRHTMDQESKKNSAIANEIFEMSFAEIDVRDMIKAVK